MLDVLLNLPRGRAPTLLFIGAHCDDIEIGCGGTVLELLRRYPAARAHWVVLSSKGQRGTEARQAALRLLGKARAELSIQEFRGAYFPSEMVAIKDFFEGLKRSVKPDVIFTHGRDELHQDHRITAELTWNTFRDHLILEYEIPKYDGGLGSPSVFMPLSAAVLKKKLDVLMQVFKSQQTKRWFTPETFSSLARLRGIECNAPSGYAEAFYVRKLVLAGAR
jgi:LmbE family N-acetylglucosaminyl deacetylase